MSVDRPSDMSGCHETHTDFEVLAIVAGHNKGLRFVGHLEGSVDALNRVSVGFKTVLKMLLMVQAARQSRPE